MLNAEKSYTTESTAEYARFIRQYETIKENGRIMYAGTLLERAARIYPDTVALVCGQATITFKQLYEKAIKFSKYLIAHGIKPRDRAMILLENSIEFYIAYYGVWQTGAVVAPVNIFLHAQELQHIIKDAQPFALIISDTCAEQLKVIVEDNALHCITEEKLKHITEQADDGKPFTTTTLGEDEMAALLYTSGTTGFPKGVMLSSRNILTNLVQGVCRIDVTPGKDKIYAALPLFHSFAQNVCVWGSFFMGGTTVLVPKLERRFLLQALEHRPTIIAGVPTLYGLFCLMKNIPFDYVRYFINCY